MRAQDFAEAVFRLTGVTVGRKRREAMAAERLRVGNAPERLNLADPVDAREISNKYWSTDGPQVILGVCRLGPVTVRCLPWSRTRQPPFFL